MRRRRHAARVGGIQRTLEALTRAHETAPHAGMSRARIEVTHVEGDRFRVTIDDGGGRTTHQVTVDPAYSTRVAGSVTREELIRRSFEFLLEREPKDAILRASSP
jgi:hypothetical protein